MTRKKKFSKWVKWSDRTQLEGLNLPGVYAIARTRRNISDEPFTYRNEIIYIGMTNSVGGLGSRLRQFDRALDPLKTGHGGAKRVIFKFPDFVKLKKYLYVSICPTTCDVSSNAPEDLLKMGEVAKQEYECWAAFAERFDRLPKFNDKKNSPKKVD